MLERVHLTYLPAETGLTRDQAYAKARARLYDVAIRQVPRVCVSAFESVLWRLHRSGRYGEEVVKLGPVLQEGFRQDRLSPGVRVTTNLAMDDTTAYVAVSVEHLDPLGEVAIRETVEAVERALTFRGVRAADRWTSARDRSQCLSPAPIYRKRLIQTTARSTFLASMKGRGS